MAFKRDKTKKGIPSASPSDFKRSRGSREAFIEFLNHIEEKKQQIGFSTSDAVSPSWPNEAPRECLYRGHARGNYQLLPTLIRGATELGWEPVTDNRMQGRLDSIRALKQLESDLFFEFLPRARKLAPSLEDDWDVLFLMRHHGVPTRLLDWTQTFGVAIYFALSPIANNPILRARAMHGEIGEDWTHPHIWLLNPIRLNADERSWDYDDIVVPRYLLEDGEMTYGDYLVDFNEPTMEIDLPVTILPEMLNDRLNAQRGLFTIHGDLHLPMEDMLSGDVLARVDLPLEALPAALALLEDAGLCESVLFPDLDALGRDLNRKYRLGNYEANRIMI